MKLFHREYGEGEPIIIAHGLFGMSDNLVSIAKLLSVKFKVYLLDMRNHGQSPHNVMHTYEAMSTDLFEFIEDKKIENPILMGHSMGGKAVMQFAKDYPEIAAKLIILDISPKAYTYDNDFFLKRAKQLLEKMREADLNVFKSRKEVITYFHHDFKDDFIIQLIQKNITKNKQRQFVWKINVDALYNNLNKIGEEINFEGKNLFVSTLFVFGGISPYFRNEDKIYIKDRFYNATIKVIKNAEHLLYINNEKELIEIIFSFLK